MVVAVVLADGVANRRRTDRDVIKVGRREGRFDAIRLTASGNDVLVRDLKVVYANGKPDDIRVRSELREGSETRPLDLEGRDRAIDRIEIVTKRDFKGRYHVLMGTLSPLQGIGPDALRIKPLLARVAAGDVAEVILATNPTVEGEATAHYLAQIARQHRVRPSRLAHGVPLGGELEYIDRGTLAHAFGSRQEVVP